MPPLTYRLEWLPSLERRPTKWAQLKSGALEWRSLQEVDMAEGSSLNDRAACEAEE